MTLRRGSVGTEVAAWQTFLQSQGHTVGSDGVFGQQTEDATKAWQRSRALTADGVVGPASLAAANLPTGASSPPAPAGRVSVAAVRGIEKLSPAQLGELDAAARDIGIDVDWLAAVISFETAGTFSPSILNAAGSKAVGLIQFMPNTAQTILKTATREEATRQAAAMGFGEQLRRMVVPYFASYRGRMKSLDDVYLAVFYPAFIGRAPADVVAREGSAVYRQNAGFDKAGLGYITKADITGTIRSVLASARGVVELDPSTVAAVTGAAKASALPLLLALGGGAVLWMMMGQTRRGVVA